MSSEYGYIIEQVDEWKMFKFNQKNRMIEYLLDDMQGFKKPVFLPHFEKVINGFSEVESTGGNMVYLKINKDITEIGMGFTEEVPPLFVDTNTLMKIMREWISLNANLFI